MFEEMLELTWLQKEVKSGQKKQVKKKKKDREGKDWRIGKILVGEYQVYSPSLINWGKV